MDTAPSGPGLGYSDSIDSSPRSRGAESWDEAFPSPAAAANSKLRLMCSYGGHIMPRPHDKSLCYIGGETRIVVMERHSSLADLTAKLSRSLLGGHSFNLKYQLPTEDLDSLISITVDEDLENMIDEYDRILSANPTSVGKSSRLRLFLFPDSSKPDSAPSSIGSILDDSKSDNWFVDALNSAMGMVINPGSLSDSASVNCLLGLDDDHHRPFAAANTGDAPPTEQQPDQMLPRPDSSRKLARHGLDFNSVPDLPMLDTSSSFGSTSSAPSVSNLPRIRVRADDKSSDQRTAVGGIEDHYMKQEEGFKDGGLGLPYPPPPPQPIDTVPLTTATAANLTISPTENPSSRVFSSDDEKSEHGGGRKPNIVDLPTPDSTARPVYHQDRAPPPPASTPGNPSPDPKQEAPVSDSNYWIQMQMNRMQPEQLQQQLQQQQQHQQQHDQQNQQQHDQQHQQHQQQQQLQKHQQHQQHQQQQQLQKQQQQQQQQQLQKQQQQQQQLLQQQQQQQSSHLIHHQTSNQTIPMSSYNNYQMPHHIYTQQQMPQQAQQYNQQIPMYYLPIHPNSAYNLPMDNNQPHPSRTTSAPQKPEMGAHIYRTSAQPQQYIYSSDQPQQYMSYHQMPNHHQSQSVTMSASPNQGYEYADPGNSFQQLYYTQANSGALPMQYQTMNSSAVSSDAQSDANQTRAS